MRISDWSSDVCSSNVDIAAMYSSRRLWDKLVTYLEDNWGLKYYSNYTRGCYVSFKMSRDELANKAETMKATAKVEKMKKRQAKSKKVDHEKKKIERGLRKQGHTNREHNKKK